MLNELKRFRALGTKAREADLKEKAAQALETALRLEGRRNSVGLPVIPSVPEDDSDTTSEIKVKYRRMFHQVSSFFKVFSECLLSTSIRIKDITSDVTKLPLGVTLFGRYVGILDDMDVMRKEEARLDLMNELPPETRWRFTYYSGRDIRFLFETFSFGAFNALKRLYNYQIEDLAVIRTGIGALEKIKRCRGIAQHLDEKYHLFGMENNNVLDHLEEMVTVTSQSLGLFQQDEEAHAEQIEKESQQYADEWLDDLSRIYCKYIERQKRLAELREEVNF